MAPIPRDAPPPPAQNYEALKDAAMAHLRALCGDWTDYNAHDPGVTLVELLSYALTDLGYRADLPIPDLLAGARLDARGGLYPPWQALASPPVTPADFRRLLLDRVEGLGNVWLRPRTDGTVAGLYDITLQPELPLPGIQPDAQPHYRRLIERTRRMFLRHRPLGEDIGSIRVLQPLRTVVAGDIHLQRGVRPEAVLAEALYRLAQAMAPEPRRIPVDEGGAAPQIEGPLMLNGAIMPGTLADKPDRIERATLAERIADIPGVIGVPDLQLWVEGEGNVTSDALAVDPHTYLSLDAGMEADTLPLRPTIDGVECRVDRGDVLRRLLRLWTAHRRRYDAKPAYRRAFAPPKGRARALTVLEPLGPQLPRVYGLSDPDRSPRDPAAAQLKGYLAIFERVMADFCARLDQVGALAEGKVPTGLSTRRHEALLDTMLTLYGLPAWPVPAPTGRSDDPSIAADHRLRAKQALLDHRSALGKRRGRGFDPSSRGGARSVSGAELRLSLLLGPDRGRRGHLALVEQVMLRPRSHARRRQDAGNPPGPMAVIAVVEADGDPHDPAFAEAVEQALRADIPAHLTLHLLFVGRHRWRRFRDLHRLWRLALQIEEHQATDQLSADLRDMLARWLSENPA